MKGGGKQMQSWVEASLRRPRHEHRECTWPQIFVSASGMAGEDLHVPFQFVVVVDLSGGCKIYNVKLSYFITFSNIIIPVWTHYIINSLNQDNQSQNKKL